MYGYQQETPTPKESPADINKDWLKRTVYVILTDLPRPGGTGGSIAAFTTKSDVERYMADPVSPGVGIDEAADIKLLHGLILDPQKLPMDIDSKLMKGKSIWLFVGNDYNSVLVEECGDIDEAILAIELAIDSEEVEIEDICVLLGEEIELVLAPARTGDSPTAYQVYGSV